MSTKLGINVYSITHDPKTYAHVPWVIDNASGLWNPEKQEPNPIILGRYKEVGIQWMRWGSGLQGELMTLADAVSNKFTIGDFLTCCVSLDAKPIIQVPVHQSAEIAIELVRCIRNEYLYTGEIYLEVGNESYLGKQSPWQWDYEAAAYVEQFLAIHSGIKEKTNILFGLIFVDSVLHPHQNVMEWVNTLIADIGHLAQWGAVHFYDNDFGRVSDMLDRHYAKFKKPLLITEWNYPQAAIVRTQPMIFYWTLNMLRLLEGHAGVLGHTIWDGGCGTSWPLFEKNFDKTLQWQAFEAYTRKGIL